MKNDHHWIDREILEPANGEQVIRMNEWDEKSKKQLLDIINERFKFNKDGTIEDRNNIQY